MALPSRIGTSVVILSLLVALLGAVIAGAGLFWPHDGNPYTFTTLHGETVEIYGRGLYRNDSAFSAPVQRGTAAVILFIAVPALLVALWLARRGAPRTALRAQFVLTGILCCFLYNAVALGFGVAFNAMYPAYLLFFSLSFFAFILAFTSIDLASLPALVSERMPHRGIAIFIFIAACSPLVWLIEIVAALATGGVPSKLGAYTTDTTTMLDVGLIVPVSLLSGIWLLRRKPIGYVLTSTILVLLVLVGMVVVGQTVMQVIDRVPLTTGEFIAYVVPFVSLAAIAVFIERSLLKHLAPPAL